MSISKTTHNVPEDLEKYLPILEGVVKLFDPFLEGALHDLREGRVVALFNNFSKRQVGDASPLHELKIPVEKFPDVFEPYYKDNWDSRNLKCNSITIRNDEGVPIGLVCFNFDTSEFVGIHNTLEKLFETPSSSQNPVEAYTKDWQEAIDYEINSFSRKQNTTSHNLTREQRIVLTNYLYNKGLFNFTNSANYIADSLGVTRQTIYNYLNQN